MKKSLKGRSYPREKAKKVLRMMKISVVLMPADTGECLFPAHSFEFETGKCQYQTTVYRDREKIGCGFCL